MTDIISHRLRSVEDLGHFSTCSRKDRAKLDSKAPSSRYPKDPSVSSDVQRAHAASFDAESERMSILANRYKTGTCPRILPRVSICQPAGYEYHLSQLQEHNKVPFWPEGHQ
jgi:hypothetical protein